MVLKVPLNTGINRIRLEFKGRSCFTLLNAILVLIESDWNLKSVDTPFIKICLHSINRIRLEFKGGYSGKCGRQGQVLIESDWNLKTATKAILFFIVWY